MNSVRINDFSPKHSSEVFVAVQGNKYHVIAWPRVQYTKKSNDQLQQNVKSIQSPRQSKKHLSKYHTDYHSPQFFSILQP